MFQYLVVDTLVASAEYTEVRMLTIEVRSCVSLVEAVYSKTTAHIQVAYLNPLAMWIFGCYAEHVNTERITRSSQPNRCADTPDEHIARQGTVDEDSKV